MCSCFDASPHRPSSQLPVLSKRPATPAAEPLTISAHMPKRFQCHLSTQESASASLPASFLNSLSGGQCPSPLSSFRLETWKSSSHLFLPYFQNNHQVLSFLPSKALWRCSPPFLLTVASSVQVLIISPWDCYNCLFTSALSLVWPSSSPALLCPPGCYL